MSSIIRILCGLALIALAWTVYQKNSTAIAAGAPVSIGNYSPDASPRQVALAFGAVGLVGAAMLLLGIVGLLRPRR